MSIHSIMHLIGGVGPRHLRAALSLLFVICAFAPLAAYALHGGAVWRIEPDVACAQGTCQMGVKVSVSGSGSALEAAHNTLLADLASTFHAAFTATNVQIDNGTYTGTLAIYGPNKDLLASTDVTFYVTGDTSYLSNPSAVKSWIRSHSGPGDLYTANATIPYRVINPEATQGEVIATGYLDSQAVGSTTSQFLISH